MAKSNPLGLVLHGATIDDGLFELFLDRSMNRIALWSIVSFFPLL